jgi:hypothetical protein
MALAHIDAQSHIDRLDREIERQKALLQQLQEQRSQLICGRVELSPYEQQVLEATRRVNQRTGAPARTLSITQELNQTASERWIQECLSRLEELGRITRKSPKTGWIAL